MEFLIPITIFLVPVLLVFIHKHFRYKEKLLEHQSRGGAPPPLQLAADSTVDKRINELQERVQNLESIIVAMDTDLAALPSRAARDELHRLKERTPALALPASKEQPRLPAAPEQPAPPAGPAPDLALAAGSNSSSNDKP